MRGHATRIGDIVLTVIALLFACALPLLASAQDVAGSGARSRILSSEAAWYKAENEGDSTAMQALLDPTMVDIDHDGVLRDKSRLIADMKAATAHAARIVNESVDVHVFGDTAVAAGVNNEKGFAGGKFYQRRCSFIATWVYRNGSWMCVGRQSTFIQK
jgi:ketosteroid isomerase-like protein